MCQGLPADCAERSRLRIGDHVQVVRDPRGVVDPEFDLLVRAARTDVVFAVVSEIALMVSSV